MKKYAISVSDGHDEDWEYFDLKTETYKRFNTLKTYEEDIHVYTYNKKYGYEVIDSYWVGEL